MFAAGVSGSLQKLDAVGSTLCCDLFRPQGALYLADVSLAQEEHADAGLADAAADCIRKLGSLTPQSPPEPSGLYFFKQI